MNSRKRYRRRKKRLFIWRFILLLIVVGGLYLVYLQIAKPYTVGLDAGHGGDDTGAIGEVIEADLTEQTAKLLDDMLKEDGRFFVAHSKKYGETKGINDRNKKLARAKPDIVISIHANADDYGKGTGFECFPSPPGRDNFSESMVFAKMLGEAMAQKGSTLRGIDGIRFGYYIPNETGEFVKTIKEASDVTVYEYGTFGILEGMKCPAVLVEQCFITNPNDVLAFAGEEGAKKAAQAYYLSICRYLGIDARL